MQKIKLEQFITMSDEDKRANYKCLSDKDKSRFRFLYDIPQARVIGYEKISSEELEKNKKRLHDLMKKDGF